ncbi:unnamed protein product, partial [Rotaria sp. Silwood2]
MPPSHWLLKSPTHCLHFNIFPRHFPHTCFLITHRRRDETLPSLCRLSCVLARSGFEQIDIISRSQIMKWCCQVP